MAILIGSGRVSHLFTVADGATETVTTSTSETMSGLTIGVTPGVGGTALCEYRLHALDDWKAWPGGTVAVVTVYKLDGAVQALRFTATVAAATVAISVE